MVHNLSIGYVCALLNLHSNLGHRFFYTSCIIWLSKVSLNISWLKSVKTDFHSLQFSEHSILCDRFLLKCVLSSRTNFIRYGWLNTFQKKAIAKFRALAKLHWMEIRLNASNYLHTFRGLFIWAGLARLTGLAWFFSILWWLKHSGELKLKGIAALSNMKACHQAK